jgi:hypothetical protein
MNDSVLGSRVIWDEMHFEWNIMNPIYWAGWDELLISAEDYSFFHSSAWARVLSESYLYTPTYFTLFDDDKLLALIPVMEVKSMLTGRRGVSLPFTDYCEPIIDKNIRFQDVINVVAQYGKKHSWKFLELRGGKAYLPNTLSSSHYLCHSLDLSQNEEKIFSSFRETTQRNIKKAISGGIEVKLLQSFESIKEFYRLNSMTRKHHGLPPQPFLFFKKIYDHILSKKLGVVILASYKKNNIAGGVYFHLGEKAVYKYGASDRRYQHLRANNLVMWEAIKWYCQNGYQSFCFGRTEPENHGLRQFKNGWGTKERMINYYKYDLMEDAFISDHQRVTILQENIFRKLPIPLLNIVGSLVYRHIG